jgi:hypothetical protein
MKEIKKSYKEKTVKILSIEKKWDVPSDDVACGTLMERPESKLIYK